MGSYTCKTLYTSKYEDDPIKTLLRRLLQRYGEGGTHNNGQQDDLFRIYENDSIKTLLRLY